MIKNKKTISTALSIFVHSLLALAIVRTGLHFALPETEVVSGESVSFETIDAGSGKPAPKVAQNDVPSKNDTNDDSDVGIAIPQKAAPKQAQKGAEPKFVPVKEFEDVVPADKEQDDEQEEKKAEAPPEPVVLPAQPKEELQEEAAKEEEKPDSMEAPVPVTSPSEQKAEEAKGQEEAVPQQSEAPPAPVAAAGVPKSGQPGSQNNPIDAERLKEVSGNRAPKYPYLSNLKREQGTVTILAYIRNDGRVDLPIVQKSSGHPALDQSAVEAYARYRYKPGTSGYAVKSFIFRLKQ